MSDFGKGAVAVIVVEYIRRRVIKTWWTNTRFSVWHGTRIVSLDAPYTITTYQQIQVAVPVIVEPDSPCRKALQPNARFYGDVLKGAIAAITKQGISTVTADVEIGKMKTD